MHMMAVKTISGVPTFRKSSNRRFPISITIALDGVAVGSRKEAPHPMHMEMIAALGSACKPTDMEMPMGKSRPDAPVLLINWVRAAATINKTAVMTKGLWKLPAPARS